MVIPIATNHEQKTDGRRGRRKVKVGSLSEKHKRMKEETHDCAKRRKFTL